MMRLLFAVSCLCCWAASVQAQTLLVLGDSLSAGYQMQAEQSWPALLNEKWQQQGGEHTLINASISGETTQGGLARLPMGVQIGDDVQVDIRGKLLKAKVTKPVFARNGKAVQ